MKIALSTEAEVNQANKTFFKEMWTWLAEDPLRYKSYYPGLSKLPEQRQFYLRDNANCSACVEARGRMLKKRDENNYNKCNFCPLMNSAKAAVGGAPETFGRCLCGLYYKWCNNDTTQRAEAAAAIRDLEWED